MLMLAPTRLSLSSPSISLLTLSLCPPSLFVTFVLYTLCPRFDSFDSFAMERENAAARSTVREKPLANDVKVRSTSRIWDRRKIFIPLRAAVYARTYIVSRSTNAYTVSIRFYYRRLPGKTAANPRYGTLMERSRPFLRIRKFGSSGYGNSVVYLLGERIISE